MLARLLHLHPKTYGRLVRLSKEAERDGAYRVANPLAILPIRLASRQRVHVLRVDQRQLEFTGASLQDVPHRGPVDAGGFHRHLAHLVLLQPVPQVLKILGEGCQHGRLDFRAVPASDPDARADAFLVYIQTGAAGVEYVHVDLLCRERETSGKR